jgi:nitroimidazol reductase NimA-like FMN-containing flavoprotein (pyridoxamine 5'-phosphate oxidase superfamily)
MTADTEGRGAPHAMAAGRGRSPYPSTYQVDWDEMTTVLSEAQCTDRLRGHVVGRVAFVDGQRPIVLPVNFVTDRSDIVFWTGPGGKLAAAVAGAAMAFEVDSLHPESETGWSVLVEGVGEEVTEPAEVERLTQPGLRPWPVGIKRHLVRIRACSISGRQLFHPSEFFSQPRVRQTRP